MKQFIELVLLAFKHRFNFLHQGFAVYNKDTKRIWSIWSERYKACNELYRLQIKYPEDVDKLDIMEIY